MNKATGFPVGIINSTWGGTPAESWTKKEVLQSDADLVPILTRYQKQVEIFPAENEKYKTASDKWKADTSKGKGAAPAAPIGPTHNKSPQIIQRYDRSHRAIYHQTLPKGYNYYSIPAHWKTLLQKVEPAEKGIPHFKNIYVNNVKVKYARKGINAAGLDESTLENFNFENVEVNAAAAGEVSHAQGWKQKMYL